MECALHFFTCVWNMDQCVLTQCWHGLDKMMPDCELLNVLIIDKHSEYNGYTFIHLCWAICVKRSCCRCVVCGPVQTDARVRPIINRDNSGV